MANTMLRGSTVGESLALTNSASTSAGFSMAGGAGAIVLVESVSGAASLTFSVKADPSSATAFSFIPDGSTTAVSQPIAAGVAFDLPGGLFAARWIIPVTNAGTATIRVVVKT